MGKLKICALPEVKHTPTRGYFVPHGSHWSWCLIVTLCSPSLFYLDGCFLMLYLDWTPLWVRLSQCICTAPGTVGLWRLIGAHRYYCNPAINNKLNTLHLGTLSGAKVEEVGIFCMDTPQFELVSKDLFYQLQCKCSRTGSASSLCWSQSSFVTFVMFPACPRITVKM